MHDMLQLGILDEQAFDGLRGRGALRRVVMHVGRNFVQQGLPRGTQIAREGIGKRDFSGVHHLTHLIVVANVSKRNVTRDQLNQRGTNRIDLLTAEQK